MHVQHDQRSRRRRLVATLAAAGLVGAFVTTLGATGASATGDSSVPSSSAPSTSAPSTSAPDSTVPTSTVPGAVSTITLPLFGAPLTVDLTTGPSGAMSSVTINPADGWTAPKVKPNRVAFVNDEGTAKVVVRTREGGGQRIDAKAGSLADLLGPGAWSGDVFGNGVATNVSFTIADRGDGSPDIVGIGVTGAAGVVGPVKYSSEWDDDGEEEFGARVSVTFTDSAADATRTRVLTVKVEVERHEDEDGEESSHAKLRISLSKVKTSAPDVPVAAGPGTWTGALCSGEIASIAYTLGDDRTLVVGAISPTPEEVKQKERGVEVRFATGERVRLSVKRAEDGAWVKADVKLRCDDEPTPSVNVPTTAHDDEDDDDDHGDERDRDRDRGRDRGRGGDGSTTTSAPTTSAPTSSAPTTSAAPSSSTPSSSAPTSSEPSTSAPSTTEDDD
jgi:hypothetical protein